MIFRETMLKFGCLHPEIWEGYITAVGRVRAERPDRMSGRPVHILDSMSLLTASTTSAEE